MIVSKACCAAHPCFCVFKCMEIKRVDVKKYSSKLLLYPSFGLFFSYCVYTDQHSLQYSLCTDQKPGAKSWNLCLIHEDWASFHQRHSGNWTGLGKQYLFSSFVPNWNFPKKMWMSNAVLTGQSLPHPVYECASEAVETAGHSGLFFVPNCPNCWHWIMGSFFKVQWFPCESRFSLLSLQ